MEFVIIIYMIFFLCYSCTKMECNLFLYIGYQTIRKSEHKIWPLSFLVSYRDKGIMMWVSHMELTKTCHI